MDEKEKNLINTIELIKSITPTENGIGRDTALNLIKEYENMLYKHRRDRIKLVNK